MPPLPTEKAQLDLFGKAMRLFNAGDFRKAKPFFDDSAAGPRADMAEAAGRYALICGQRLGHDATVPRTAEEHYTYGITLLNQRRLDDAVKHLKSALSYGEDAGAVHYALGLAIGLNGDPTAATHHLQRAFSLDPKTRALARTDADFLQLASHAEVRRLLDDTGSAQ